LRRPILIVAEHSYYRLDADLPINRLSDKRTLKDSAVRSQYYLAERKIRIA
jgi:hypothetical protein